MATKLNIKYKDFLISNIIVVVFTIILVLIANNILISRFGFTQETFYPITIFLVLLGGGLYYFLSKQIIHSLFAGEHNIKNLINPKKTI